MSNILESFIKHGFSSIGFPSSFDMSFALKVSQLCRICLTFALVRDERHFSILIFFDAIISPLMELALMRDKRTTGKNKRPTLADSCEECMAPPSLRNSGVYSSVHRNFAQNYTARSISVTSKRLRSRLSSKRSFPPFLGSRTDSRPSAAGPLERFLSLQDFQRQADIGRLVGEELLQDDWEQELLLEPGYNRIGMKIRRPSSRCTYVSSYTI